MNLIVETAHRNTGGSACRCRMTKRTSRIISYCERMIDGAVVRKIGRMAGRTIAATIITGRATGWHQAGRSIDRLQRAVAVMTSEAGIVNHIIGAAQWDACRRACCPAMTSRAFAVCRDQQCVVATISCPGVTGGTVTATGIGRVMVNRPSWISRAAVAIGAAIGHYFANSCPICPCSPAGVASPRIYMAESAGIGMDADDDISIDRRIVTGCSPATGLSRSVPTKIGSAMTSMNA